MEVLCHYAKKDILGFRPPPPKLRLSLSILNKILKKVPKLPILDRIFAKKILCSTLQSYISPFSGNRKQIMWVTNFFCTLLKEKYID